jgi:hypothetical protein
MNYARIVGSGVLAPGAYAPFYLKYIFNILKCQKNGNKKFARTSSHAMFPQSHFTKNQLVMWHV